MFDEEINHGFSKPWAMMMPLNHFQTEVSDSILPTIINEGN